MYINDKLNLVIPLKTDGENVLIYGYHTSISHEVFEANYRSLSLTKAAIASKGTYYQMDAGPRIAALTLKDEVAKEAEERGIENEGGKSLLAELRRLTMILIPGKNGWDMVPVDLAISGGHIDAEDWLEAESMIVFFTCHFALARKAERKSIGEAISSLMKGLLTSLNPSAFVTSLPKSTKEEPLRVASSPPS